MADLCGIETERFISRELYNVCVCVCVWAARCGGAAACVCFCFVFFHSLYLSEKLRLLYVCVCGEKGNENKKKIIFTQTHIHSAARAQ